MEPTNQPPPPSPRMPRRMLIHICVRNLPQPPCCGRLPPKFFPCSISPLQYPNLGHAIPAQTAPVYISSEPAPVSLLVLSLWGVEAASLIVSFLRAVLGAAAEVCPGSPTFIVPPALYPLDKRYPCMSRTFIVAYPYCPFSSSIVLQRVEVGTVIRYFQHPMLTAAACCCGGWAPAASRFPPAVWLFIMRSPPPHTTLVYICRKPSYHCPLWS